MFASFALTGGVLRQEVHCVCVEELQEGPVDGVGEVLDLDHVLLVLLPLRAEHGAEVFTPAESPQQDKAGISVYILKI